MKLTIQYQREADGRIIAEIPALPGVVAYGLTKQQAKSGVVSLAQMVINLEAERKQARATGGRI